MMNKNYFNTAGIMLTAVTFLGLYSCRTNDTEQSLQTGGVASVKINVTGTDYAASTGISDAQASVKSIPGANDNAIQRHGVMVTPSLLIETELTPDNTTIGAQASAKLNTKATIEGNPLGTGNQYRVIAYRKSDGAYVTHKDYTIGNPADGLTLDAGETYDLVAYSKGANALSAISEGEMTNISNANLSLLWTPFIYQKQTITPTDGNSTINMTLRHKEASITTVITSYIGGITSIESPYLNPFYKTASASLENNGVITTPDTAPSAYIGLTFPSGTSAVKTTGPMSFLPYPTGITGSFSANITIGGTTKTLNLNNFFTAKAETRSTLNINLRSCGAYLGPNQTKWTEFMCQNLGATAGIDPFSPVAGNHGAKYQWGAQTGEAGRYYSQANDQGNSGAISGWINYDSTKSNGNGKANGSWTGTQGGGTSNPCPAGYRIPTLEEGQNLVANNTIERVGTWANSSTNYSTAIYFKNPQGLRTLMLSAVGYRNNVQDGGLYERGSVGRYWSSTISTTTGAYNLNFNSNTAYTNDNARTSGFAVRCIKDNTSSAVNGGNTSWNSSGNINITTTY
ncbi:hypothetical protein CMT37_05150 [Elizabethkingia anophelis]|nr:hypothetical protein [Elizabethkingia anophelis]